MLISKNWHSERHQTSHEKHQNLEQWLSKSVGECCEPRVLYLNILLIKCEVKIHTFAGVEWLRNFTIHIYFVKDKITGGSIPGNKKKNLHRKWGQGEQYGIQKYL